VIFLGVEIVSPYPEVEREQAMRGKSDRVTEGVSPSLGPGSLRSACVFRRFACVWGGPIAPPHAWTRLPRDLSHTAAKKRHGESHEATHAQQPGLTCDQPCSAWPPPPMLSRPSLTRC
jgi:hypothetical protein